MVRSILKIFIPMLALIATLGCFNSEKEYESLENENKVLAESLQVVENENIILNRALENIKAEKESLQSSLEALNNSNRNMAITAQSTAAKSTPPSGIQPTGGNANTAADDYWIEATDPVISTPPMRTTTNTASGGSGKIYTTQPGDVLSTIAEKHNTTTARLLDLNPQLRNRRDYMIWANDKIKVP